MRPDLSRLDLEDRARLHRSWKEAQARRRLGKLPPIIDVVLPHPRLLPAAVPYLLITLLAGVLARRAVKPGDGWGRDDSTRRRQPAATNGSA